MKKETLYLAFLPLLLLNSNVCLATSDLDDDESFIREYQIALNIGTKAIDAFWDEKGSPPGNINDPKMVDCAILALRGGNKEEFNKLINQGVRVNAYSFMKWRLNGNDTNFYSINIKGSLASNYWLNDNNRALFEEARKQFNVEPDTVIQTRVDYTRIPLPSPKFGKTLAFILATCAITYGIHYRYRRQKFEKPLAYLRPAKQADKDVETDE